MKATNIVIVLDKRRKKQDQTYPLILRLGHKRTTTAIPLGISLREKDWDDDNKLVRKSYVGDSSSTRVNNIIQKTKGDAMEAILKLHEAGQLQSLTVTELKEKLFHKDKTNSFFHYTQNLITDLVQMNRLGTARCYKGVVSVLKTYCQGKDLAFSAITYGFLTKFETYHKSKGNGENGLSVYIRTIRAIYNKAIKDGIIEQEQYPFKDYKIKSIPTKKRALDGDILQSILTLQLDKKDPCFNARNYFVCSYMMYGMNFSDMAFLKKTDLTEGRILYQRKKTKKVYDIKIAKPLHQILDHYVKLNKDSDYVFPIIKRTDNIHIDRDIMWARKRYNKKLKLLADKCGIESILTSYVSRHSFATQALMKQVPLSAISSMLGHSSLKTTEIYLKALPSNILDEYNSIILQDL